MIQFVLNNSNISFISTKELLNSIILKLKFQKLFLKKNIASARINIESSALLKELNDSLLFDKELFIEDIIGSIAHARMLSEQAIISKQDFIKIEQGLNELLSEIESGKVKLNEGDEVIHMGIERLLTAKIGDAAKRVHTARSRNNQVATLSFRFVTNQLHKEVLTPAISVVSIVRVYPFILNCGIRCFIGLKLMASGTTTLVFSFFSKSF